jgi:multidrug resistance protein
MMGTLGSGIIYPCLGSITTALDTTPAVTNLSIAFYMLSMAIFPLWWSAASEAFGRRNIYLVSFALNVVFNVISALSNSIGMLIASRILVGGASASVQAVGAGSIADIWQVERRGQAMSIFYLGTLCGPVIAPIIGGALALRWDWRAPLWFLVIFGGVTFILVLFTLPETLKSQTPIPTTSDLGLEKTSTRQSVKAATHRSMEIFRVLVIEPPKILIALRFMPIALLVYCASISFASLFVLNISIQSKFESQPYNFSTLIVGLLYVPSGIGYIAASLFGGRWMDHIMVREAKKANRCDADGRLVYLPEDRMRENAWLGALLYPLALILYGWTVQTNQFWFVPVSVPFLLSLSVSILPLCVSR